MGLVASLNRPGANVTGSVLLAAELAPKQLQLLRELIPNAAMFGVLADPAFLGTQSIITDLQAATGTLGLQLDGPRAASRAAKKVAGGWPPGEMQPGSHATLTAIGCPT